MSSAESEDLSGYRLSVVQNPPGWEVGIYLVGFLVLLGAAGLNIWKLWKSGTFPAPSPFPNFDYRYPGDLRTVSLSHIEDSLDSLEYGFRSEPQLNFPVGRMSHEIRSAIILPDNPVASGSTAAGFICCTSCTLGILSTFVSQSCTLQPLSASFPQVQTNAFTVIFDERFSVPMDQSALDEYSLRFAAFGIDADERNISAGLAELKLSDLDLTIRPFNAWLYLQDVNKAVDAVGEILLSLSYLPTAERLTVVVAKCKNLIWTNEKNTADPFVKVYLLQDGRKISKKKTSTKRDDTNPIFNEAMIFSVPSAVLQELSLRVTVAEATDDGRGENLGHVIIGPEASGMGITHWNQMLATLRKPVSMWHPLRRI